MSSSVMADFPLAEFPNPQETNGFITDLAMGCAINILHCRHIITVWFLFSFLNVFIYFIIIGHFHGYLSNIISLSVVAAKRFQLD